MNQLLILTASILVGACLLGASAPALAYKDGTYNCKNEAGIPDNVYKIDTQSVGTLPGVPYVDIHRFYKDASSSAKISESHIRGFAVVSTADDQSELLTLGYARLEFVNGELFGCKK